MSRTQGGLELQAEGPWEGQPEPSAVGPGLVGTHVTGLPQHGEWALCTRLAIMVNGRFRCLGSAQHLKGR